MTVWPLLSTNVKYRELQDKPLILISRCLLLTAPDLVSELETRGVVLHACPEEDRDTYHGKIAVMLRCVRPSRIEIYTVDGSPHCFMLHTACETAVFITGLDVEIRHYVIVKSEIREISREAIRVARYLHLVDELVRKERQITERLRALSLEHRALERA